MQAAPAFAAAVAPSLGAAENYTVLGASAIPTSSTVTCTNTGPGSAINGNVGTSFTSITNTLCSISGATDAPIGGAVVTDLNNAISTLDSQNSACDGVIPTTSTILPPGIYCSAAGTSIGTGVTFSLNGSASDVWVFRVGTGGGGALTGTGFDVVMGGSALPCNVYWRSAEATTMTDSDFIGTVLAGTDITMTRGSWEGRALAKGDATITDAADMTFAGCRPPNTITVNTNFTPDSNATVSIALSCTSGTVQNSPLDASASTPAIFTVSGASPGATCTATETVPDGYTAQQDDCMNVSLGGSCQIINTQDNPPDRASFLVSKHFTDGNPMDVEVTISCNTGLILDQSKEISENSDVEFVVTSFDEGELNCDVTETLTTGYFPAYTATATTGLGLVSHDDEGCHFDEVISGQFVCRIVNTPDIVDIEIQKLWVFDSAGSDEIDTRYTLSLYCDEPIGLVDVFQGDSSATYFAQVRPEYPSSSCWVVENVSTSSVEIHNGCNNLIISAATGGDSCLITNTVFYEGIPTLSQYALAILALSMLMVGFVGFRRFI